MGYCSEVIPGSVCINQLFGLTYFRASVIEAKVENQRPNPVTSYRGTTWRFPSALVQLSSLDWPHQKFSSVLKSGGKWLDLTFQRNFLLWCLQIPFRCRVVYPTPSLLPFTTVTSAGFSSVAPELPKSTIPFVSPLPDDTDSVHLDQYWDVHKFCIYM